jgi:hypothetical protein
MKVDKSQAQAINSALIHWQKRGLIDNKLKASLASDIEIMSFDWSKLAKYSLWVSLICLIISLSAVLLDEYLLKLLQSLFNASHILKFIGFSLLSAVIFWLGFKRRSIKPEKVYTNEAILFLGVLSTAQAVYQLGKMLDTGSGHFSLLLLLSFFIYSLIGFCFRSNLVWLFAILSLGSWMGAETGYMSGWGMYFLRMNYPLRFLLLGMIITFAALALEKQEKFSYFFSTTLAMGLLYLFISTWIMSIFGNYGDITVWKKVKQIELFHWSILFALFACGAIYHGLKYGNGMTRGFGLTFLFINLYTRFFEFFWDATHKAIFFAILALSFWVIGSKAEKIWHLGEGKYKK